MTDTAEFLDGRVRLLKGDARERLADLADDSIDSVVTDPPYALVSIVKRFGKAGSAPPKGDVYARAAGGFMGKEWDTGETAFTVEFWEEVLRVLRPGGHLISFSGTRSYHRMVCAIEDAGFEIRDQIGWAYGSGFPKSHDVARAIDRHLGAEGHKTDGASGKGAETVSAYDEGLNVNFADRPQYEPASAEARDWQGWGTALKPAWEPVCLARKPLSEKSIAANVLAHGTGAINIDGCKIQSAPVTGWGGRGGGDTWNDDNCGLGKDGAARPRQGRWPANLVHDGSPEATGLFPDVGVSAGGRIGNAGGGSVLNLPTGKYSQGDPGFSDSGSAARFFYTAKADGDDRLGSGHPTVKPLDLMQWLVRLVTPKGGVVLDPFAGTGTTGEAAVLEGCSAVLIEREEEYWPDIERRMALIFEPARTRKAAAAKAKAGRRKDSGPAEAPPLLAEFGDDAG